MAEIASSSVSYDLNIKLQVYRRNAVREYLVCRVPDRRIDWYVLREGRYELMALRRTAFIGAPSFLVSGSIRLRCSMATCAGAGRRSRRSEQRGTRRFRGPPGASENRDRR